MTNAHAPNALGRAAQSAAPLSAETDLLTVCTPAERRRAVLRVYRDRAAIGFDPMAKGVVSVIEDLCTRLLHAEMWLTDCAHQTTDCKYPGDVCVCGLEELRKELDQ